MLLSYNLQIFCSSAESWNDYWKGNCARECRYSNFVNLFWIR